MLGENGGGLPQECGLDLGIGLDRRVEVGSSLVDGRTNIGVERADLPGEWLGLDDAGVSSIDVYCPRCAFGTANGHTLSDALNDASPRSYRQCAMRFPPQRSKRSRSHSSALLDNGSPNNANNRPAQPIFELNLW
jgi:hypothetical protein